MTQKFNPIQKPYHLSIQQTLLIQGLTWIGGLGLLSSGVVLAQTAPTEATAVPSTQELLTPATPEVSRPEPVQVAPEPPRPERVRPERSPEPPPRAPESRPPAPAPQVSAPSPQNSASSPQPAAPTNIAVPESQSTVERVAPAIAPSGDRPAESPTPIPAASPAEAQPDEQPTIIIPANALPEFQQNLSTPQFEGVVRLDNFNSYIDPTDYSIGATRDSDQPTVILSERSSGCQAVLASGQPVPANLCSRGASPRFTAGAGASDAIVASQNGSRPSAPYIGSVNVGPITLSSSGVSINRSAIQSYSPQNFFNLTSRPAGLPGNGNLKLMFPLSVPASITSAFGWRIHPIFGESRFHSGTDIGAPMGTPVLAAFSGQVVLADFLGGYGLTIVLQHGDGTQQTLYAHLSEIFVRPGEQIEQGQVLGRVGSTGNSTGPHLHFEVRQQTPQGWVALDPGVLLQASLSQFWQNLQTAGRPQLSNLVALKDLSKASSVVGTAYSVFLKEDPSQLVWREIFDKEFAVPETGAIAASTPAKLSLPPVSLNQIPMQTQQ